MSDPSQPDGAECSEESIFLAALEISDPGEQARYLDEACGEDEELRAAVELLLQSHRRGGRSFLDEPAAVALGAPMEDANPDGQTMPSEILPGDEAAGPDGSIPSIPHYRVLRRLGACGRT